jgi:hypothetical protein
MEGTFRKEIHGNELYLYNGKGELIFKRWLDRNWSVVFDVMTYDKGTLVSITDKMLQDDKDNSSSEQ